MFGSGGDNGPAEQASLAGPAGLALVEDSLGRLTIFIADYYNGTVRAVDFNGIMRNVSDEGRVKFGAPSRVAFAPGTGWLYVADSSNHQVVALNIPVALLSRGRGVTSPRGSTVPAGAAAPTGGPAEWLKSPGRCPRSRCCPGCCRF